MMQDDFEELLKHHGSMIGTLVNDQTQLTDAVKKLQKDQEKEILTIKENFLDINKKFHSFSLEISAGIHKIEKKVENIIQDRLVSFEKKMKEEMMVIVEEKTRANSANIERLESFRGRCEKEHEASREFKLTTEEKFSYIQQANLTKERHFQELEDSNKLCLEKIMETELKASDEFKRMEELIQKSNSLGQSAFGKVDEVLIKLQKTENEFNSKIEKIKEAIQKISSESLALEETLRDEFVSKAFLEKENTLQNRSSQAEIILLKEDYKGSIESLRQELEKSSKDMNTRLLDNDRIIQENKGILEEWLQTFNNFKAENQKSEHSVNGYLEGVSEKISILEANTNSNFLRLSNSVDEIRSQGREEVARLEEKTQTNISDFSNTLSKLISEVDDSNKKSLISFNESMKESIQELKERCDELATLKEQSGKQGSYINEIKQELNKKIDETFEKIEGNIKAFQAFKTQEENARAESQEIIKASFSKITDELSDRIVTANGEIHALKDEVRNVKENGMNDIHRSEADIKNEFEGKIQGLVKQTTINQEGLLSELELKFVTLSALYKNTNDSLTKLEEKHDLERVEFLRNEEVLRSELKECLKGSIFEHYKNELEEKIIVSEEKKITEFKEHVDKAIASERDNINSDLSIELSAKEDKITNLDVKLQEQLQNFQTCLDRAISSQKEETGRSLLTVREELICKLDHELGRLNEINESQNTEIFNNKKELEELSKVNTLKNESLMKIEGSFEEKMKEGLNSNKMELITIVNKLHGDLESLCKASIEKGEASKSEFTEKLSVFDEKIKALNSCFNEQSSSITDIRQEFDNTKGLFSKQKDEHERSILDLNEKVDNYKHTQKAEATRNFEALNKTVNETIETAFNSLKKQIESTKKESLKALYSSTEQLNELSRSNNEMKAFVDESLLKITSENKSKVGLEDRLSDDLKREILDKAKEMAAEKMQEGLKICQDYCLSKLTALESKLEKSISNFKGMPIPENSEALDIQIRETSKINVSLVEEQVSRMKAALEERAESKEKELNNYIKDLFSVESDKIPLQCKSILEDLLKNSGICEALTKINEFDKKILTFENTCRSLLENAFSREQKTVIENKLTEITQFIENQRKLCTRIEFKTKETNIKESDLKSIEEEVYVPEEDLNEFSNQSSDNNWSLLNLNDAVKRIEEKLRLLEKQHRVGLRESNLPSEDFNLDEEVVYGKLLAQLRDDESLIKTLREKIYCHFENNFNQRIEPLLKAIDEKIFGQETIMHQISALVSDSSFQLLKPAKSSKQEVEPLKHSADKKTDRKLKNSASTQKLQTVKPPKDGLGISKKLSLIETGSNMSKMKGQISHIAQQIEKEKSNPISGSQLVYSQPLGSSLNFGTSMTTATTDASKDENRSFSSGVSNPPTPKYLEISVLSQDNETPLKVQNSGSKINKLVEQGKSRTPNSNTLSKETIENQLLSESQNLLYFENHKEFDAFKEKVQVQFRELNEQHSQSLTQMKNEVGKVGEEIRSEMGNLKEDEGKKLDTFHQSLLVIQEKLENDMNTLNTHFANEQVDYKMKVEQKLELANQKLGKTMKTFEDSLGNKIGLFEKENKEKLLSLIKGESEVLSKQISELREKNEIYELNFKNNMINYNKIRTDQGKFESEQKSMNENIKSIWETLNILNKNITELEKITGIKF